MKKYRYTFSTFYEAEKKRIILATEGLNPLMYRTLLGEYVVEFTH